MVSAKTVDIFKKRLDTYMDEESVRRTGAVLSRSTGFLQPYFLMFLEEISYILNYHE